MNDFFTNKSFTPCEAILKTVFVFDSNFKGEEVLRKLIYDIYDQEYGRLDV
jgi:hypothetical protein